MEVAKVWRTRARCVDTQNVQETKSVSDQHKRAKIGPIEHPFETTVV